MDTAEHFDDDQPLAGNWVTYFNRINRLPDDRYRRLLDRILDITPDRL